MNIPGMMGRGGMMGGQPSGPAEDTPQVDTAENVQISSLALLKMLSTVRPRSSPAARGATAPPQRLPRAGDLPGFADALRHHRRAPRPTSPRSPGGRARVLNRPFGAAFFPHANKPSDRAPAAAALRRPDPPPPLPFSSQAGMRYGVMGLMLGQFVDDYTVKVVDADACERTGARSRWIRCPRRRCWRCSSRRAARRWSWAGTTPTPGSGAGSHAGHQHVQALEALNPRLVSVVIDPVQSVKGKVVDAAVSSTRRRSCSGRSRGRRRVTWGT